MIVRMLPLRQKESNNENHVPETELQKWGGGPNSWAYPGYNRYGMSAEHRTCSGFSLCAEFD